MESWAVWSIVCVLFGMAGFWGGILQHAHQSAGDGGVLQGYQSSLGVSLVEDSVTNSIVPLNCANIFIPAGTISVGQTLQVYFQLEWLQNTGIARNDPSAFVIVAGQTVGKNGNSTSFASSVNPRMLQGDFRIVNIGGGLARVSGRYTVLDLPTATTQNLIMNQEDGGTFAYDFTIDTTLRIQVINAVAAANYTVTHKYTTISKF